MSEVAAVAAPPAEAPAPAAASPADKAAAVDAVPQSVLQRGRSLSRSAAAADESAGVAAAAATSEATTVEGGAQSSSEAEADPRPAELIQIQNKRTSLVTDEEIQQMLFDDSSPRASPNDSAAPAAAAPLQPARVASLAVQLNRCSILPASVSKLRDLSSLSLHSAAMELICDEEMPPPPPRAEGEGEEAAPTQPNAGASTALTRSESGLRALRSLRSLELVHSSPPPLSSDLLPESLEHLSICNYALSDAHFFSSQLSNLRSLSLARIRSLKQLPDSVSLLQKLETLSITQCPRLSTLPQALLALPALTDLNLSRNGLYLLPDFSAEQLPALKALDVSKNRLLVLPRVFLALQERGCQLLYDEQLQEQLEAERASEQATRSTVVVEEIRDEQPASPRVDTEAAASSSAAGAHGASGPPTPPSHKPKRKLQHDAEHDAADAAEQPLPKHARSSSHAAAEALDEPEVEDAQAALPHPADAATAAAAAEPSKEPTPRARPAVPKRRREDSGASTAVPDDESLKRQKDDPAAANSFQYFLTGELGYSARVSTGFFDPGRHSALFASAQSAADMSLARALEQPVDFSSRETVLVDFERDVRLRQILRQARLMLKQQMGADAAASSGVRSIEELHLQVKLLACLVSDSFGGRVVVFSSQHAASIGRESSDSDALHAAAFAAGASAASSHSSASPALSPVSVSPPSFPPSFLSPLSSLHALCHAETSWWRRTSNSNCVLLGSIQHGLCRHRSLLMKILCDELFAPGDVRCKLVRGFREGGAGHAWTVVSFRGQREFIVDTLDSPMLFRPLSSLASDAFSYFPQFSEASDPAFTSAEGAGNAQQIAFKDLYRAQRGRLIGAGAYSEVFECRLPSDAGTSHALALKVTPTAHLSPAHFSSLLKEIRLLPHLRHPNIVSFLGWLITPSTLNLFLELVVGQNLDIALKTLRAVGQRLTVEDILVVAEEIAEGLSYLHEHATLHRDLKSAQVLIGHEALTDPAPGAKPFAVQLHTQPHPERTVFKARRKFTPAPGTAASSAAATTGESSPAAAASSASSASLLPAPLPGQLSFFSSAAIKLADFNISSVVVEPSEESDVDAPHLPVLEYVGTLRWCAPEVFRASAAHTVPAASASAASAASASSATSPSFAPASASARLTAGKRGDVWSYGCVILELLTLHLPYEDVPTEPELNEMLRRGERSSYQAWLDEAQWPGVTKLSAKSLEEQALRAWERAVQDSDSSPSSATAAAAASSSSASVPLLRASVYQALVGLYLQSTSSAPEKRPSMADVVQTLSRLHAQMQDAQGVAPRAKAAASTADPAAPPTTPRAHVAALPAAASAATAAAAAAAVAPAAKSAKAAKHARDRSASPTAPARSSRARIEQRAAAPATASVESS